MLMAIISQWEANSSVHCKGSVFKNRYKKKNQNRNLFLFKCLCPHIVNEDTSDYIMILLYTKIHIIFILNNTFYGTYTSIINVLKYWFKMIASL